MRLVKKGAEALIYLDEFEGQQVLVKERIKKGYRLSELDEKLRRERTRRELKLLRRARSIGVATPQVYHVDKSKIFMEFVKGERIKEFLNKASRKAAHQIFVEIGKLAGKLHSNNLIHGDLTTSNMILRDNKIYLIDFGLGYFSKRIEDKGVDLLLLKRAIKATHSKLLSFGWKNIVRGYRQSYANAEEVLRRVEKIEERARYMVRKAKGER